MTKLKAVDEGYKFDGMKASIFGALNKPITQKKLAGLIRIFVPDVSPLWSHETVMRNLYAEIKDSSDPYQIEEASRILVDESIWYDSGSKSYHYNGADNNGW